MNQTKINSLMKRREEIALEMIEASSKVYSKLNQELGLIEEEVELLTGMNVEQFELQYYAEGLV